MSRYNSFDSDDGTPRNVLQWNNPKDVSEARNVGKSDGLNKRPMSPEYVEKAGTDETSIAQAYSEGYKQGREEAYKKTGSNRRRKTRKHKKQSKKSRKHRK